MEPSRCDDALTKERPALQTGSRASASSAAPAIRRERRLQLRAYNHWASLLSGRRVPSVADLSRGGMLDFSGHSVLLDVTAHSSDPVIAYLGDRLAEECGTDSHSLLMLADAPAGSLLSRLADRYREVVASGAPTGLEAEFVGCDGKSRLYRGILLPFSGDDAVVDHVLAVVNWKEKGTDAFSRPAPPAAPEPRRAASAAALLTDWADGPGCEFTVAADQPDAPGAQLPDYLADRLRALPLRSFATLAAEDGEFALALIRRPGAGPALLVGEVPHDALLVEQAARRLLG